MNFYHDDRRNPQTPDLVNRFNTASKRLRNLVKHPSAIAVMMQLGERARWRWGKFMIGAFGISCSLIHFIDSVT